eukprot:gnl/MRDRNA2_/MRDRNA2_85576_c2_seq4.p1 gnl/MRDRNA2_/MRDRNA2_85576_c2~~gnl/MRDRNA2_/MRDRNA2_85576_c2_seq4.p1  ORF type:complete len:161 (+),score=39.06 gnl/MRDRNA2_/MRDRNA2_85576_c2_seq4:112-594(+)
MDELQGAPPVRRRLTGKTSVKSSSNEEQQSALFQVTKPSIRDSDKCSLYRIKAKKQVGILESPNVKANVVGHLQPKEEFFTCGKIASRSDGREYVRLADGKGWVSNRSRRKFTRFVIEKVDDSNEKKEQKERQDKKPKKEKKQKRKKEKKMINENQSGFL